MRRDLDNLCLHYKVSNVEKAMGHCRYRHFPSNLRPPGRVHPSLLYQPRHLLVFARDIVYTKYNHNTTIVGSL